MQGLTAHGSTASSLLPQVLSGNISWGLLSPERISDSQGVGWFPLNQTLVPRHSVNFESRRKLGKPSARCHQDGLKLKNIVMWPHPQEKARLGNEAGSQDQHSAVGGLKTGHWSPIHGASSPSLRPELMRGVYFIYCYVLSLLRLTPCIS